MSSPELVYLQSLHHISVLAPLVQRFSSQETLRQLQQVFSGDLAPRYQLQNSQNMSITDGMAQISHLVLPEIMYKHSACHGMHEVSQAGAETIDFILESVFQPQDAELILQIKCEDNLSSLLNCARYSTVLQAYQAREMCLAALIISLSTSNCLAVLEVATSVVAGCPELHARAAEICLSDMQAAIEADEASFALLSANTLSFLLQHDDLMCSEDHVFLTILKWVESEVKGRRNPLLRQLAGSCIRPSQLSYNQLILLDAHPLVSNNMEAISIVSGLLIRMIMTDPEGARAGDPKNRPRKGRTDLKQQCQQSLAS
ncbi:hypothetical protein CEUSTIGMA_g12553.t1 [Chlamydomonas eustigma]|uniref:BACK domain-containing protein n=1 Tax=Chlamydomonas eustigma TaxID=1157962 RepID=A0A250XQ51_9CHLO|nr:hypothetical protein CEUSTIGMA_g12553.t1 [Chlamydomonas eustigma]|eukprot:GAX85133.1 hypothetical protein CEUSTIGMA_g12553.t1 [Chlamydomonas eustigma]